MLQLLIITVVVISTIRTSQADGKAGLGCPLEGTKAQEVDKCLKPLRTTGLAFLTSNPFDGVSPNNIYDICKELTEMKIDRAINCVINIRDQCMYSEMTEDVRLLDMNGVRHAIKYMCANKYVLKVPTYITCRDLQKAKIQKCIKEEIEESFELLKNRGKANDAVAIRCSALRIKSFCNEEILRTACGYKTSVFTRTVMDNMMPQTCNCRKEFHRRDGTLLDVCYDTSECLSHLRPGMIERDLYEGVILGAKTLNDVKHFCDYYNSSILENRITKGINCVEQSNHWNCTYATLTYKRMNISADNMREAATLICDRIHTFEQYQDCFERGHDAFAKCVENQWLAEGPELRSEGQSNNLERYLMSQCRIRRRCVEHTYRVCSVMLLDILEEVNRITSPPLCKKCEIKGTAVIVYNAACRTYATLQLALVSLVISVGLIFDFYNVWTIFYSTIMFTIMSVQGGEHPNISWGV